MGLSGTSGTALGHFCAQAATRTPGLTGLSKGGRRASHNHSAAVDICSTPLYLPQLVCRPAGEGAVSACASVAVNASTLEIRLIRLRLRPSPVELPLRGQQFLPRRREAIRREGRGRVAL